MFASGKTAAVASAANYVEECFSTTLYTGNGSTQTITNGIDLSTKGGLVWIKNRTGAQGHNLYDTARGRDYLLRSNSTAAQAGPSGSTNDLTSFNTNGFSLGTEQYSNTNDSAFTYASWTFRKQPKFFDIVTWTGDGVAGRVIPHNLGSTPGCILVKRVDGGFGEDWYVYHRSLNANQNLVLNSTAAAATGSPAVFGTVDSTGFQLTNSGAGNSSGYPYVAYLFAHNAGGFGLTGTDNVISCGSYTGNGSSTGPTVTLGYEPQWVMIKNASNTGDWVMFDNMRGLTVGDGDAFLYANTSAAESTGATRVGPTSTGFYLKTVSSNLNTSGDTYIYIAIRRGPMKVPTSGTSVFTPIARSGTGSTTTITAGFPVDLEISKTRNVGNPSAWFDRLRGATKWIRSSGTNAEATTADSLTGFDSNTSVTVGADASDGIINYSTSTYSNWMFRRAPSFFDEVCYTGTGTSQNLNHNLSAVPELIIVKRRNSTYAGRVYSATIGNTKTLVLFSASGNSEAITDTGVEWDAKTPTSSVFSVGAAAATNASGDTYVAYLFATCAGVSKVGSYTGNGSTQTINCSFTGGARFVLIKRTDSTGDWYVWDSARGIVSGNDPYLLLNSTAAETTGTDYIDPYSAGFEISSTAPAAINASGGTFIFLAIA